MRHNSFSSSLGPAPCGGATSRFAAACTLLALTGTITAGCGQSIHYDTFGIASPDNQPARIEAVLARLSAAPVPQDHGVAYGVGGEPSELFVVDLESGRELWRTPASPRSWPHMAGDVIVSQENGRIVARDVRTGAQRFGFDDHGLWLVGAAGAGHLGAFTLSSNPGATAQAELVIVHGTEVTHRISARHAMGYPEVAAGMVMVPWGSQYVSFLDGQTSEELARVRVRGSMVGHAFAQGGHVYLGQLGLFRLTPSITSGTAEGAAHYAPPEVDLPGRPSFMVDPYREPPAPDSAVHRVRVAFRPSGQGEDVRLTNDTLYALFHRVVFALDAANGQVRWAYRSDRDLSGAEPLEGALLLADDAGAVTVLDARNGSVTRTIEGTHAASLVRFHAQRIQHTPVTGEPDTATQLASIADQPDTRLSPASVFALRALRILPGDGPTATLVTLCESDTASRTIRDTACDALAERTDGRAAVLAALSRHADFVTGARVPALAPLADAAARMEATEAAPLLVDHLWDPATPDEALPNIVSALGALGDEAAAAPLLRFVRVYHADASANGLRVALEQAIDALCELAPDAAYPVLGELMNDPATQSGLRMRAEHRFAQHQRELDAARAEREALAAEAAEEQARAMAQERAQQGGGSEPVSAPLTHLTREVAESALAPVMPAIRECMDDAQQTSVRLTLVVNPTGEWSAVGTSPASLQTCVAPLVRSQAMPAVTSSLRQRLTFVVSR
ncbi:MAG: PQQ-binding-like beta-propeller repeat protein [Sandaracinaceae bacterium]|nr:PQQ-binding-like beta-propeller repeat protein [Sandaracinaceae bacterium]